MLCQHFFQIRIRKRQQGHIFYYSNASVQVHLLPFAIRNMLRDSATASQILQQLAEYQLALTLHDIVCLRQFRKNSLRIECYLRSTNHDCSLRTQLAQHTDQLKYERLVPNMYRKSVNLRRHCHDFFQHRQNRRVNSFFYQCYLMSLRFGIFADVAQAKTSMNIFTGNWAEYYLQFSAQQIFNHKYRKSSTTEIVEPKFTGAEGRTRTGTSVNPLDFESSASANSATSA